MCQSQAGRQRALQHPVPLFNTSQGWLVAGELGCYQTLTDREQEARLQPPVAVVLVKCLAGYETEGVQKQKAGPAMRCSELVENSHLLSLAKGKITQSALEMKHSMKFVWAETKSFGFICYIWLCIL